MCELPTVTGLEAIRAFEKDGFVEVRIKGSHHILKKKGHRFLLSVPVHGNRTLKPGTLKGLIRGAGMTVERFVELCHR